VIGALQLLQINDRLPLYKIHTTVSLMNPVVAIYAQYDIIMNNSIFKSLLCSRNSSHAL